MEWGYRRVRQLLRKLRTPGAIQDDDLARTLCSLTGAPSVRDAVLLLAERALRAFPPVYWTIVRRVDVEGESSQSVSDQIHLSERSFFRYRAAAIAAIAAEIEAVTRSTPPRRIEDLDVLALVARGRYLWKHRTTAALQRAARYFERALEIDPTFARLHATLADLHLFSNKDLRRAKESFDLALSIDPTYSTAHHFAAWHAMISGDLPGAMDHLRIGLGYAPDGLELQTTLSIVCFLQGATEQGVRHLTEVLDLDPDFSFARYNLAHQLAASERYAEAAQHLDALATVESRESYTALAAFTSARSGDARPARRFLDRTGGHRRRPNHYLRAYARLGLGERSEAVGELRAAVEHNEPWTILLPVDRLFQELHDDRAFRTLLPLAITAR